MEAETRLLEWAGLLVQSVELREASRALCAASQQQRNQSPWPHPVVPIEPADCVVRYHQPTPQHAEPPSTNPHLQAMEILQAMSEILALFPIEQQVAIVKALAARTIAKARERTRPRQAALSA